MSASHLIEMCELGRVEQPPALVSSLMRDDERLLWVARLESAALTFYHARYGLFLLSFAVLFILLAPWQESLQDYCTSDRSKCTFVYYALRPGALFLAAGALVQFWQGWKSRYRPAVLSYAVTTRRALSVDESRPWDARSVYLDLYPAQAGHAGIGFQGSNAVRFMGLGAYASARAAYWAMEGRRAVLAEEEGT